MLNPNQIKVLFESLAVNQPMLRDYLQGQLDEQLRVLVSASDAELLRRAQGKAQSLQSLLSMLDQAKDRLRKG